MRPLHVMREHTRPASEWPTKVDNTAQPWPTIVLTPVYDESLGHSLGTIDQWMSKDDLHKWIQQRLVLVGLPPDYALVPPVGWYRDPDYNEN